MISKILNLFRRGENLKNEETVDPPEHIDWFHATFDQDAIYLDVKPPGKDPWTKTIPWKSIERICYEFTDFMSSDGIYIFMKNNKNSIAVPSEAVGGTELWGEIIEKKLFDAELFLKAASEPEAMVCWPPIKNGT